MLLRMSTVGADGDLAEQWRGLMARHQAVNCALGSALGQLHGIGVQEFEVLENLVAAEDGQRRIQDLSEAVSLSHAYNTYPQTRRMRSFECSSGRRSMNIWIVQRNSKRTSQRPTRRLPALLVQMERLCLEVESEKYWVRHVP